MRISTTTRLSNSIDTKADSGFTLVELLVVIFVIGLASAAVVLSLPGDASLLRNNAETLAARIAAARDQAVLESRPMAVWIRPSGYGFEQRSANGWQPAIGKSFQQVNWTDGTQMAAPGNATGQRQQKLIFDVTGLPSAPASFQLRKSEAQISVNISAAGDVSVAK